MLRRAYRYIVEDYLLRNSALLAIGAMFTGVLNYLFQLYAARLLTVEEYGVMGAFYALFYTASFAGQAISLFTTKNVAVAKRKEERAYLLYHDLLLFGGMSLLFFLIYLAMMPLTSRFLHVDSYPVIILAGAIVVLSILGQFIMGFARGIEDFVHPTVSNIVTTFFKLLVGIGLVLLGYGVGGAFWGIAIGALIGALYLFFRYRTYLFLPRATVQISYAEFGWYFTILLLSIAFIDLDVLLVKYYFSSFDAGVYAALSLMGKIVFFVCGAIAPVMFPRIVKHFDAKEQTLGMRYFWKTILMTIGAGGAIVLAYWLAPDVIVHVLYSDKYPIQGLLALMGLFVLLYCILNVLVMVALALRVYSVLFGLALGILVQIIGIMLYHATLTQVVYASMAGVLVSMLFSSVVLVQKLSGKKRGQKH